ncbi:uncharacterized protein LOC110423413 [Herrania umbratica]|uniref:Uncharacterized protein LOC110423413 n=1 Tax=Herrania umbratica TaxID=108875 RepID=A0A6J1B2B4_9ROSI|nr:uncharacterized protein LOC110423413 [Herrania umbratica]
MFECQCEPQRSTPLSPFIFHLFVFPLARPLSLSFSFSGLGFLLQLLLLTSSTSLGPLGHTKILHYGFPFLLMEDYSINSSLHKSVASKGTTGEEESGWTAYFEDFSNNDQQHSYCSSFSRSSSLISDAATTGAAWKTSHNNHHVFACSLSCADSSPKILPKKLRFKKTRTKEICHEDDSLEDTASSPVNSPKVSNLMKSNDMNLRKREDQIHSSLGKETTSENYSEIQNEEESKTNFDHGKNDFTELKKRGLCLVPLSTLVNYLG